MAARNVATSALPTVHDRYSPDDIRAFYAAGYWRDQPLVDLVAGHAAATPDKTYAFDSTTSLTYAELLDRAARLAAGLRERGVGPGDRVAVQLPNWTELVLAATALGFLGAVLVPIMPIYRDDEVAYVLDHSGARVAITCGEFRKHDYTAMYERVRSRCPDLEAVVTARAGGGDASLDDLLGGDAPELDELRAGAPSPDDPFLLIYTSGTTSRPKGCLHTLNTLRASAAAIARSLRYTADEVQFGPSPVGHGTGMVTSYMLPLHAGASSHLMEVWEPVEGLRRIAEHRCTVTVTATAFLQMAMSAYDPDRDDASSMRLWVCAGSPIPGAVVRAARERFDGCQVLSLYGRSENFLTTMCTVDDPPERSASSDGSALDGAEIAIVDEGGAALPAGEQGDIAYRGPSHMIEYFRDPEATAALFTPEGFSRSGDLGKLDDDGFVRVTGRLKDVIIRGGLNISARELEDHLAEFPGFGDVVVVGYPDERLGEKVCVCAVPADGQRPELDDVVAFLRERRIATPKLPQRLELFDALPMTASGKVQKHLLQAELDPAGPSGS